jgi:hypothetical protein
MSRVTSRATCQDTRTRGGGEVVDDEPARGGVVDDERCDEPRDVPKQPEARRRKIDSALTRARCHTQLSEENQVHTYMHARIMFHAYSDIKVYTEIVSRMKKKDYQRFTLYPGNEGSKHHRQSTGGCVRLALATSSQDFIVASFF